MSKKTAILQLQELINYYSDNKTIWEAKNYKEAQTRAEFIDKFFEALGWQISGIPASTLPQDKDVLVEHSLKNKSLDYIFKIKNQHQFIVEAKKPSESLDDPNHIFQAKSYGFLAKVPFVILTNFKELKIYDILEKPHLKQPKTDLIFQCTYDDYIDKIDYIFDNFSKDAIYSKSLIKLYVNRREELKIDIKSMNHGYIQKQGEELLDKTFLYDLDAIRQKLAQSIVTESDINLSDIQLNELTQRLINIILFIRFLEDNKIEDTNLLRNITNQDENYLELLINLCSTLNQKYNGLLFHEYPLFNEISIDHTILKTSILDLYYPESPYDFSKISIEILGQIFEQYLAKRIVQNDNIISINTKSEIRKAGGIYYTPEYIVDNIIDNTLNKFIVNQDITDKFNIAKTIDFSCGSGVFLIKAFKNIIQHFQNNSEKVNSSFLFKDSSNQTILTMEAKKIILQQNIYGIDIDSQAIEIVKMSLYFTMLENFHEDKSPLPLLPSLERNIICGNSIVDLSFFDDDSNISIETIELINPLSWEDEDFSKFDIVIGNPPYLRIQVLEELYPIQYSNFLKKNYNCSFGNFDLSIIFIEKGILQLSENGYLGYIVPNTILNSKYGKNLRELIIKNNSLSKIINFNDCQVFQDSTTYTCLLFLNNEYNDKFEYLGINNIEEEFINTDLVFTQINKSILTSKPWYFSDKEIHIKFFNILSNNTITINNINNFERIFVGLQPSINKVFLLNIISETSTTITCFSKALNTNHTFEKDLMKKLLKGSKNIFRYEVNTNSCLLFPYINNLRTCKSNLIPMEELQKKYPLTWSYLHKCKKILHTKKELRGDDFYKFIFKKNHIRFDSTKILIPSLCYGSRFALDINSKYYFTGSGEGGGGGYGLLLNDTVSEYNYYNILGILNSKVISTLVELKGKNKSGGYKGIDTSFINNIPLPMANTDREKAILKEISTKTKKLNSIFSRKATKSVGRIIKSLENKINSLTLEIYNITEQEVIDLIESTTDKFNI